MKKLYIFYLLSFALNILINLAHPVTPTLIKNANIGDYMFGIAYGFMAIGQVISSLKWGKIALKKGEINTIVFGILIYLIGQILFFKTNTFISIISARLLSGIGAGGFMVASISYLIKISELNASKNLTFYTALTVFSSTIGYLIGGIVGDKNVHYVCYIQVILALFLIMCFKFLMPEYVSYLKVEEDQNKPAIEYSNKFFYLNILVIFALIATTCYDQTFNYYIKDVFDFKPSMNGYIKAFVGVSAFIVGGLFSKIQKSNKNYFYLNIIFFVCICSLLALASINNILLFLESNVVFYISNSLYLPILQSIYIHNIGNGDYSVMSGKFNLCKSLGMIIGAFLAGLTYEFLEILPFIIAACLFFICIILLNFFVQEGKDDG